MKRLRDLTRDELEQIARQAAAGIWLTEDGTIDVGKQVRGADYLADLLEPWKGSASPQGDDANAGEVLQTTSEFEIGRQSS